jgi:endo-1,4-beta-xylanase
MSGSLISSISVVLLATMLSIASAQSSTTPSLKEEFASRFRIGVALGDEVLKQSGSDALQLVIKQFNSATPENQLKWEKVHPEANRYDFEPSGRFVAFGEEHGFFLVGHTLVWHSQTPEWVFQQSDGTPMNREQLLERMEKHISKVVGRYRGRIHAWDVVNEALNDDGTMRDTPWRRIIGNDYLEHAFRFAKQADPEAELYYNDYSMHLATKRKGAVRLVKKLKRAGCRVDGIGMQGHWGMDYPSESEAEKSINAFASTGAKVMITEMDINVLPRPGNQVDADVSRKAEISPELDPYKDGLPDEVQQALTDRYAMLFGIFQRRHAVIDRVTFWGIDDGNSWHNYWPIHGRTAHSLLFDRSLKPKPAFDAVVKIARSEAE